VHKSAGLALGVARNLPRCDAWDTLLLRLVQCDVHAAAHETRGEFLLLVALTARSLHCSGSVRLQSYFLRPDEPVSMPARDPISPCCRVARGMLRQGRYERQEPGS
jgi:hypothetical protein